MYTSERVMRVGECVKVRDCESKRDKWGRAVYDISPMAY